MSLRLRRSAFGWLLLHNNPEPPILTGGLPVFHLTEVKLLKYAPQDLWAAVIQAKDVFPGATVVEFNDPAANRRRFERRQKRRGNGAWHTTNGTTPDPDDDSTDE